MDRSLRSGPSMCKNMGNSEIACPKPRRAVTRIGSGDQGTCKPLRKLTSCTSLPGEGDPGREILEILLEKARSADVGSPSPFLCGSPPVRASNPVIHDVDFRQKQAIPSPVYSPQKFSCRQGSNSLYKKSSCAASYGREPFVRIEGFASPAADARGVLAFA